MILNKPVFNIKDILGDFDKDKSGNLVMMRDEEN